MIVIKVRTSVLTPAFGVKSEHCLAAWRERARFFADLPSYPNSFRSSGGRSALCASAASGGGGEERDIRNQAIKR
jgi:hypothetical protein